jgi:hypothetical protein
VSITGLAQATQRLASDTRYAQPLARTHSALPYVMKVKLSVAYVVSTSICAIRGSQDVDDTLMRPKKHLRDSR